MTRLRWDESFSVQVKGIDEQHKELFEAVEKFEQAVDDGEELPALVKLLDFLIDYSRSHFALEEKYFDELSYEDAERHKEQHQAFIDIVQGFKRRFDDGDYVMPVELKTFLGQWLREHVITSDLRYVKCFREHGLT